MAAPGKKKTFSITLIGAGNVGYHLGLVFYQQGFFVNQVFSRKKRKAQQLAKKVNASAVNSIDEITPDQDLYILAVHDDAIQSVAKHLRQIIGPNALVVHTSGACPATILKTHFRHYGVFYPLQSFSRDKAVDWTNLPICVFAKYKKDHSFLLALAQQLSKQVFTINDDQRAQLHLAAVFVNNFTNLCYQIGHEIVQAKELPFDILLPLIQQTVDKVKAQPKGQKDPALLQTGPAVRGDQATIDRHLKQLESQFPAYEELYLQLTKAIQAISKK